MTRVSRARRHIPCGGPGGVVLSEHQGGGLVQDGHGDLLLVVMGLPSLVVLGERLARTRTKKLPRWVEKKMRFFGEKV